MEVERTEARHIEKLLREDLAVGHDHKDVRLQRRDLLHGFRHADARGLHDRNPAADCQLFDGGGHDLQSAAGWPVRLRHHADQFDSGSGSQPLQSGDTDVPAAHEDNFHRRRGATRL